MKLSYGVIGNTSVFGTEESRFEPWWDNKAAHFDERLFLSSVINFYQNPFIYSYLNQLISVNCDQFLSRLIIFFDTVLLPLIFRYHKTDIMTKYKLIYNRKNKLKKDGTALIQLEFYEDRTRKYISIEIEKKNEKIIVSFGCGC